MSKEQYRYQTGDMLYHALNKNIRETEDGLYQPKKNDIIAVGQVIYTHPKSGMIIAYYEGVYRQQNLSSRLVTSILKKTCQPHVFHPKRRPEK
jgi:hypothetical protein